MSSSPLCRADFNLSLILFLPSLVKESLLMETGSPRDIPVGRELLSPERLLLPILTPGWQVNREACGPHEKGTDFLLLSSPRTGLFCQEAVLVLVGVRTGSHSGTCGLGLPLGIQLMSLLTTRD